MGKNSDTEVTTEINSNKKIPLSFPQQRLWFLNKLIKKPSVYNISLCINLYGILDIKALEKSLQSIVHRHASLRTCFVEIDGLPEQNIKSSVNFKLQQKEIIENESVEELLLDEAGYPFDLTKVPLLRGLLIKVSASHYVLLIVLHHIIADGKSLEVLAKEINAYYNHYAYAEPLTLPELPFQYSDFSLQQRENFHIEDLENKVNFWLRELENSPVLSTFPADYSRPREITFNGATFSSTLEDKVVEELADFSRKQRITPFITLLAGWYALLFRYTGQEDIVVGFPVANRNMPGLEDQIGFFANTLPLRIQLKPHDTFLNLIQQIKEKIITAFEYQDLPFEKLVESLKIPRELSYQPVFQTMCIIQNIGTDRLNLRGLKAILSSIDNQTAKFDILLSVINVDSRVDYIFEYSTDLFKRETIERISKHYVNLLKNCIDKPEQRIDKITFLDQEEVKKLIYDWNETKQDFPSNATIYKLFEQQAQQNPENIAIKFEKNQLTYRELNKSVNQLTLYLQKFKIKPSELVAISLERGINFIISLLSSLKAGCHYLALDPTYPEKRLIFMLEDAEAAILITEARFKVFDNFRGLRINLDIEAAEIEQMSEESHENVNVTAEDLAYIVYTSGSTGKPKGIQVAHRTIVNLVTWEQSLIATSGNSFKVAQFASIGFDISLQEIGYALFNGCQLCIVPDSIKYSPASLATFIDSEEINRLFLPTAFLDILVTEFNKAKLNLEHLQNITVAGEALKISKEIKLFFENHPHISLINEYGPSEAHVVATYLLPSFENETEPLPLIGKPIMNIQFYVLDSHLQPVPIGVAGELYVGGVGLAKGYANRPELTALSFIKNPYSPDTDKLQDYDKLYKTGDLVRYLSDGSLDFLGRVDQQVKIRGYRIELAEIEAVLGEYPAIKDRVVIAINDTVQKRLVAYLVMQGNKPDDVNAAKYVQQIKQHLNQRLPEYMVPTAYIFLEKIPLMPTGKVDKQALPIPSEHYRHLDNAYAMPRNNIEQWLVELWQELLGINSVGINDNFFSIGGHSLLLARLIHRIEEIWRKNISVIDVFKFPTIAQLASLIKEQSRIAVFEPVIPIQTNGSKIPLILIHPASGLALPYLNLAIIKDRPIYGISNPCFDSDKQFASITEMAAAYTTIIMKTFQFESCILGGWSLGGNVALSIAEQLKVVGVRVPLVLLIDSYNPGRSITNDEIEPVDQEVVEKELIQLGIGDSGDFRAAIKVQLENSIKLLMTHIQNPYLGTVALFKAAEEERLDLNQKKYISLYKQLLNDQFSGWQEVLPNLSVTNIKGKHSELFNQENVKDLIEKLIPIFNSKNLEKTEKAKGSSSATS